MSRQKELSATVYARLVEVVVKVGSFDFAARPAKRILHNHVCEDNFFVSHSSCNSLQESWEPAG
jgi:hypothetical protein